MREESTVKGKRSPCRWQTFLCVFMLLVSLGLAPWSVAAEERSYHALLSWLEEYREATPPFNPGST